MTKEEIEALIKAALEANGTTLKTEILAQVNAANSGLAASLSKEFKKSLESLQTPAGDAQNPQGSAGSGQGNGADGEASGGSEGKLTLKMLQQQLESLRTESNTLKQERDQERQAALNARKSVALSQAIAAQKALNPNALQKLLGIEFGDALKEENGTWLVAQGDSVKSLNDAIAGYLATDEGKAFVAPSGTTGAGSTESKAKLPAGESSAMAAILEAF